MSFTSRVQARGREHEKEECSLLNDIKLKECSLLTKKNALCKIQKKDCSLLTGRISF